MNARLPNDNSNKDLSPRRFPRGVIEIAIACALTLAALLYMAFTARGNPGRADIDSPATQNRAGDDWLAHK